MLNSNCEISFTARCTIRCVDTSSIKYALQFMRPSNRLRKGVELKVMVNRLANRQSQGHLVRYRPRHHLHPQSPPMLCLTTTFPAEAAPRAIASLRQMLLRPLPQRRLETNRLDRPTMTGMKLG